LTKQKVTRDAASILAAAAIVVALACSDSSTSEPLKRVNNNTPGGGGAGDSSTTVGGTDGNPTDSSTSGNPAPKPVPNFTLLVHVGTPHVGAADTLANDPLAGATVTVSKFDYVFTGGNGADSVHITETPVANATTDGNGEANFPNLKGDPGLVVTVSPPAGVNLASGRVLLPQAYAATMKTTIILLKP
jgi:hypothetical protein